MSVVAGIRSLLAQGFTIDQALAAAEAFEPQKPARSANAERQARYRARKNERDDVTNNVTNVTGVTNVTDVTEPSGTDLARAGGIPNPSLRSGLLVTPLPSEGPQTKPAEPKSNHSRGSILPPDWTPPDELFAYGASQGLSRSQTAEIIEGLRLWARANRNHAKARKADWVATMQGAIRRDAAKIRARAGPQRHAQPIETSLTRDAAYDLDEPANRPDDFAGPTLDLAAADDGFGRTLV